MLEYKGIKIPETAEEWQLFGHPNGSVDKASDELTEAAKDMVDYVESSFQRLKPRLSLSCQIVADKLNKNSKFGATDTEPRNEANRVMNGIVNQWLQKIFYTESSIGWF